jgi:glutamine synthetase
MFTTVREMLAFIRKEGVVQVDLRAVDLVGKWHHLSLPSRRIDERLFEEGEAFDASNMPGFKTVESGDMVLLPDPTTAFADPFFDDRTLAVICDVVEPASRAAFPRDPRGIAHRAEAHLKASGVADEARFGPEFEFYLLDDVRYRNGVCTSQYEIFCGEGRLGWPSEGTHGGATLPYKGGYHAIPPEDRFCNVRAEIVRLLEEAGVPCRYHHHEVGSMGQQEIEVLLHGPVRSGDISMMVKYFVRNVAARHHLVATFMPKPFYTEAGTGMHFHQHLWSGGENRFHDPKGYGCLSLLALQYVAGLLSHAPALLGLTNPSTNSYRRLVPGHEAPINCFFSLGNRSAAIRIPSYANQPDATRIEFRPPDPTCNPYLAMAAMLLAGIDGVKRKADPTALGYGPYEQNIYEMTEAEREAKIHPLPTRLELALSALLANCDFLFEGKTFDRSLVEDWVRIKREACNAVRLRPHPYEVETLLDC